MRGFFFALTMISQSKQEFNFWKANPIGRPALAIGFGVVAGNEFAFDFYFVLSISCCLCILSGLAFGLHTSSIISKVSVIHSVSLILACCSVGCLSSSLSIPEKQPYFCGSKIHSKSGIFKFEVLSEPINDSLGNCKFNAHLESFNLNDKWEKASGKYKCKIWLYHDSIIPSIKSTVYLFGKPNLPGYSAPNDQFDYRTWLINNKFDGVINTDKYLLITQEIGTSLQAFSSDLRARCLTKFSSSESMNDEAELAGALLLGDRKGIDPSLTQAFVDTGIIHLLAVSGLHVGLVFNVIAILLGFCFKNKKFNVIVTVLSLISLWSYALITGMSASVIRAACMLSMVIIGKGFKRKIPPFNLLLGSASILIVIDPGIILDIGFQLSFCAVFGILAANPILNLIKQISYRLLRLILVSSTISLAAQAATLPVSFFYFGRFPVYFLLSNLLAIPLASVISYLGFAAIIFQSIPFLGDVLIWFTLKGIGLLIAFSHLVASLPNASISFQTLELSTCILLGYLIIMILLYSYFSLSFAIKSGLTILILCSLLEVKYPQKQSQYILYKHNRNQPSLTLATSKFTQQSVHLYSEGILLKQNSSCNQPVLALGNTHYTLLLSCNDFIPTSRPKGEFILLIVGKINLPQFETWIDVVQPNLVLVAPWVYGNQKNILEAHCSSKGINVWNHHFVNRLDI